MVDIGSATNWVDMVGLAVVICLFIYGVVRGFMLQLAGIIVLVASLVVATLLSPPAGEFIRAKVWSTLPMATAKYACFAVILLICLGVGRALSHLARGAPPARRGSPRRPGGRARARPGRPARGTSSGRRRACLRR